MLVDVLMPKLGESITEGTIIKWQKNVGDAIGKDETLLEIGTDKVDSEIPSPAAGVIKEILAQPNDVLPIDEVIARIETEGDGAIETVPAEEELTIEEAPPAEAPPTPPPPPVTVNVDRRTFYTPLVRAIGRREGVSDSELATISGTGRGGRVTKGDIMAYLKMRTAPTSAPEARIPAAPTLPPAVAMDDRVEELGRMRQIIAENMRHSLDTSAHVYIVSECDVTNIVEYVKSIQNTFVARENFGLTYTPFFILAAVKAIQTFPRINAFLDDTNIVYKKNINIGMALDMDKGLMVPVIQNCEELNFLGLCRKVKDLTARGRANKITPDELQESTFTVSNFGIFGNVLGMPIINQPNSAILGVGAIKKQPVVRETDAGDAIVIRSICYLSLGIDHRLLDGADGGRFLQTLVSILETMDTSLLL
ncbi:MAG: dihydrolipoamide acetyltransferase family protein [Candidatus Marinimicrobia bacterium]|jgi:2-oxoglutarate dehydrogenase E2 component (dihydrolipoamide succinyltransferase)|nr:dihydrolipoamide acetyltransferase family protein [Candidatus Neomarinimicrobiota bacterium]MDP7060332.1 dihydrolipoamide acetyltransferase family protein [Candidatus Neomarinimicrobiota bacterium]|tara:strand:+ start:2213 stop:3478 length:1266 start_codon:yes stop_codon:yes gene_type:complete